MGRQGQPPFEYDDCPCCIAVQHPARTGLWKGDYMQSYTRQVQSVAKFVEVLGHLEIGPHKGGALCVLITFR